MSTFQLFLLYLLSISNKHYKMLMCTSLKLKPYTKYSTLDKFLTIVISRFSSQIIQKILQLLLKTLLQWQQFFPWDSNDHLHSKQLTTMGTPAINTMIQHSRGRSLLHHFLSVVTPTTTLLTYIVTWRNRNAQYCFQHVKKEEKEREGREEISRKRSEDNQFATFVDRHGVLNNNSLAMRLGLQQKHNRKSIWVLSIWTCQFFFFFFSFHSFFYFLLRNGIFRTTYHRSRGQMCGRCCPILSLYRNRHPHVTHLQKRNHRQISQYCCKLPTWKRETIEINCERTCLPQHWLHTGTMHIWQTVLHMDTWESCDTDHSSHELLRYKTEKWYFYQIEKDEKQQTKSGHGDDFKNNSVQLQ